MHSLRGSTLNGIIHRQLATCKKSVCAKDAMAAVLETWLLQLFKVVADHAAVNTGDGEPARMVVRPFHVDVAMKEPTMRAFSGLFERFCVVPGGRLERTSMFGVAATKGRATKESV